MLILAVSGTEYAIAAADEPPRTLRDEPFSQAGTPTFQLLVLGYSLVGVDGGYVCSMVDGVGVRLLAEVSADGRDSEGRSRESGGFGEEAKGMKEALLLLDM